MEDSHGTDPAPVPAPPGAGALRALVMTVLAVLALAALAFVVLGLLAAPPQTTVQRLVVAPWRTTVGDAATAAGFAVTVLGLVLAVRAGQVGPRRSEAADTLDTLDGAQRRAAARALAGDGHGPDDQGLRAARALAVVRAARWTVMVLFAGLVLTALGRAVVAADAAALAGPGATVLVLAVLLLVLERQRRQAQAHLLHHPDRSTPPAVLAALAPWSGQRTG